MNGIPNGNANNMEKPYPGCLGRMANLFDLGTGVAGNRLLADKPHHEGSDLPRSRSEVSRTSPVGDKGDDKVIISELRRSFSNRKSDGTPIKALIAQEMLKEIESKHNPPSVVAKLMGLDSLPCQQHDAGRSHSRGYSLTNSDTPSADWQEKHAVLEPDEYKDVYDIWHRSPRKIKIIDKSPQKGRIDDREKNMALVRQKFVEVKRVATDEKLRQSKQFKDALEVLSSNGDLLLKLFQEPNSIISQHLHNLQSIPPPTETKRITILKPSKMVYRDTENEKQRKNTSHGSQVHGFSCDLNDHHTEPTRIVVLKPSYGRPQHVVPVSSSKTSSSVQKLHDEFCIGPDDEKEQMFENLSGNSRDETLLSSVFSNGYIGDESSFNKSEIGYDAGNLSNSEIISPVSRHLWDYINRFGSPYSSSLRQASYSPESSVCREAKKRLSERWALTASNGSSQPQRHMRKRSSKLGDMLAHSDAKESAEEVCNKEQESSDLNKDENADNSPRNFVRSKSVLVSSAVCGARLNVEVSSPGVIKATVPKELTKSRSAKSSFKGRVSSLFLSRNMKSTKEKASQCSDEPPSNEMPAHSPDSVFGRRNQEIIRTKAGNLGENPDQPNPIPVLDLSFEENYYIAPNVSDNPKSDQSDAEFPVSSTQSNLIDKSPLIGSIARTLSWNDGCVGPPTLDHVQPSTARDEGQEWFSFIQNLLSVAGFTNETNTNSFTRWHSSESPLDPSLREKVLDLKNDKEIIGQEARRRQRRSTQKLVFDCVNTTLVDIAGQRSGLGCGIHSGRVEDGEPMVVSVDRVWEWLSGKVSCCGGYSDSLVVEGVARKEVAGKGWVGELRKDVNNLGEEIERKLVEELVEEAIDELRGRV